MLRKRPDWWTPIFLFIILSAHGMGQCSIRKSASHAHGDAGVTDRPLNATFFQHERAEMSGQSGNLNSIGLAESRH